MTLWNALNTKKKNASSTVITMGGFIMSESAPIADFVRIRSRTAHTGYCGEARMGGLVHMRIYIDVLLILTTIAVNAW